MLGWFYPNQNKYLMSFYCHIGNSFKCQRLGTLYEKGGDFICSLGHAQGITDDSGITEPDFQKSEYFYKKYCDYGYIEGCYRIARMYQKGRGGEVNIEKSKYYYKIMCERGNKYGCEQYINLKD